MENQNADGLEIVAIGSLYKGPWDKKYWSSSRGKDRYPYPVGYQAVRTCAGDTYRMEIQEGPNGPLFLVKASGGKSAIGQTPDIAWEKFHKKSNSRIKIWHGKRFSFKISGIELFGFRNPLVQRLLRELVANEDGLAENGLVGQSCCEDSSGVQTENHISRLNSYPDLLLELEKQQISGKKSRKRRTKTVFTGPKRMKTQYPSKVMQHGSQHEVQTCNNGKGMNVLRKDNSFTPHQILKKDDISCDDCIHQPKNYVGSIDKYSNTSILEKEAGEVCLSPRNEDNCSKIVNLAILLPEASYGDSDMGEREPAVVNDGLQLVESHHYACDCSSKHDPSQGNADVFRSKALDGRDCLADAEESRTGILGLRELKLFKSSDLLVPDSFEALEDNTSDSTPGNTKSNPENILAVDAQASGLSDNIGKNMQDEGRNFDDELNINLQRIGDPSPVSEDMPYTALPASSAPPEEQTLMLQSDQENHPPLGSQYSNSEMSDSGLVGKEIAKSLIAMLLPEAFPLLEKDMHKKKVKKKKKADDIRTVTYQDSSGIDVLVKGHRDFKNDGLLYNDALDLVELSARRAEAAQEEEQVVDPPLVLGYSTDVKHITPDGIKDDYCRNSIPSRAFCSSCLDEAGPNHTHTRSSKGEQENALTEGKLGFIDMEASVQVPKPAYRTLVSELRNTPAQHHEIVSSVGEYVHDSSYVRELTNAPCAHHPSECLQPNLSTDDGRTPESSVEKFISKLAISGLSYRKENSDNDIGCNAPQNIIPESSTTVCGTPDQNEDSAYEAKRETTLAISSFPTLQNKTEVQTSALGDQDILNVSKHDPLSLPAEESFPILLVEDLLNTIPGKSRTNPMGVVAHKLMLDGSDNLSQKELRFEVFARDDIDSTLTKSMNSSSSSIELIGCCMNPIPVSSVLLRKGECGILLCLICGLPDQMSRTIFIYEFPDKELIGKHPSLHGHAMVLLPKCSYSSDLSIYDEKSKIQFTPDGKFLVLHDSVRTSWCRKQDMECLCNVCKSACDGTLLKVVSVKAGYVSVVAKLKMVETASCLLVCEPCYIVASEKRENIHVWSMNASWSMNMEEFTLPGITHSSSFVVDLQKMPQCQYLIVGHDGVGQFCLWDISRRVLLAKFSYSDCPIHQFLPFAFFCCPKNDTVPSTDEEGLREDILRSSELSFSGAAERSAYFAVEGEIVGIWLLVLAVSYDACQSSIQVEDSYKTSSGYWRLALLVKNVLVLGSILDARSSAANVLLGHGIMGRSDGLVYTWELSTGRKVATLNDSKGGRVSFVASDESSNTFAVASDDSRVLLYTFSSSTCGS